MAPSAAHHRKRRAAALANRLARPGVKAQSHTICRDRRARRCAADGGDVEAVPRSWPSAVARGGALYPRADRTQLFRSEEHTSEFQSLMRISYAVFCFKKKKQ